MPRIISYGISSFGDPVPGTPRSMDSLFSDFVHGIWKGILGGVRDQLGLCLRDMWEGLWRVFRSFFAGITIAG